jgi:CHASE2 domain-containing sensor protein
MYRMKGTACIFSFSQDSFCSTSTSQLSTVLAVVMTMWQYYRSISAVELGWVIPVIVPLAFLLAFVILMWAGAF